LKELINNIEAERIHYRAISEQLQRELAYSRKESSVSYNPNENRLVSRQGPDLYYRPPQYDDMPPGTPTNRDLSNYEYVLPKNDVSSYSPGGGSNNMVKFEDIYQPPPQTNSRPQSQASTPSRRNQPDQPKEDFKPSFTPTKDQKKTPQKLPMHLASSVTFEYPDQFDQFYRKNQTAPPPNPGPNGGPQEFSSSVNPHIREEAQKAYFQSHLDPVFDWSNTNSKGPMPPQFPQGSQLPAQELTQSVPPKSQMNTQQKHTQIMKLENSLLTFQMDRDRLQGELEKIPESHRLSHNQKQRREELEKEIVLLDKNINTVKLKLRDIKN
jgi:hypothetical protein